MFDPQPSESQVCSVSANKSQTSAPGTSRLPLTPSTELSPTRSSTGLEDAQLAVQHEITCVLQQDTRASETTDVPLQGMRTSETMCVLPQGTRAVEMTGVLPQGTRASEKDHAQSKILLCEYCDASFISTGGLSLHKNSVHFKRKFVCTICKKRFTRKANLTHHMTLHNTNRNNVVCPFCHMHFLSKDINNHISTEHEDRPSALQKDINQC